MRNNKGFSPLEIIIVVAVIAIIGVLGWFFWNNFVANNSDQALTSIEQNQPPAVDGSKGLSDSETYLNELDVDSAFDTSEIDQTLQ